MDFCLFVVFLFSFCLYFSFSIWSRVFNTYRRIHTIRTWFPRFRSTMTSQQAIDVSGPNDEQIIKCLPKIIQNCLSNVRNSTTTKNESQPKSCKSSFEYRSTPHLTTKKRNVKQRQTKLTFFVRNPCTKWTKCTFDECSHFHFPFLLVRVIVQSYRMFFFVLNSLPMAILQRSPSSAFQFGKDPWKIFYEKKNTHTSLIVYSDSTRPDVSMILVGSFPCAYQMNDEHTD